jgi:non-specific protein-tyrosine kinase
MPERRQAEIKNGVTQMPMNSSHHTPQQIRNDRPLDQEKMGWFSPTYAVSQSVVLDPYLVMENHCVAFGGHATEVEPYRVLRTKIMQRSEKDGGNTLMVTSAVPGEGKTLTAINLALTFAREFSQTALLVDCDLRQQQIHKSLGYYGTKGLADYLIDDEPMANLIVWPGIEKLTVISGGRTVDAGSELLGSPGMRNLAEDMKNRYPDRQVIFDVPSILTSADALSFAPLVDYIVVVVRAGHTSVRELQRALHMLPQEKIVGLVLNRGGAAGN